MDEAMLDGVLALIAFSVVMFWLVCADFSAEEFNKHDPDDWP